MTDASLSARVTADIGDFVKKFDDMRASIDKLGSGVTAPAKKAADSIGQIKAEISSVGNLLKSGALIAGGSVITAGITVPIINLGKEAVMMADKLRQSEIAFTVMLGSAQKATSFLRDLQAFAARTPFEFPELQQSAKKMLALGFSAEQVIPTLTNVGNAVSGLGGNAGTFDRIILALGQMQAKGQVMAQEMRQLAEAGIPAWQILADAIGITVPEAMERVTKKQVDATTAIAALQAGMAAKFGGLMEQQSQTIQGTLANLKDTVGFIMTDIGREIIETLKIREGLAAVQEFAKGFLDWFRQLDQGTKQVLLVLTGVFAIGGPILVAVGAFMAAMAVVTAPILIGGAIVGGIVAGVALILLNWQKIKDTGSAIWTSVKDTVVGTARAIYEGIVEWLVTKASAVAAKVQGVAQSFAKPFEWLADHLVGHSVVPDMVTAIEASMNQLPDKMVPAARRAVTQVKHIFAELEQIQTAPGASANLGPQVQSLDLNQSSGQRASLAATVKAIETGKFTYIEAQNEMASVAVQTWGGISSTVSGAFAQQLIAGNDWQATLQQLGTTVLSNFVNMGIQMATQWLVSLATQQSASEAAQVAALGSHAAFEEAKTALSATNDTARFVATVATAKLMDAVMIASLASMSAMATAALAIAFAVSQVVAGIAYGAAAIMAATPFGQPAAGALIVATTGFEIATGAAIVVAGGVIQAALGAAIIASSVPAFATGGAVFGPTLALVGENATRSNPEYIGHANQLGLNRGGGGPVTLVLNVDGRTLAKVVAQHLGPQARLQGAFS